MEENEEQSYGTQAPAMPYNMMGDRASIIEKINPDEIVELIRRRLMGQQQNPENGKWEDIEGLKDNSISETCAWDLTSLILSISNQNTSLSKLDDKTIRKRAYGVTDTAVKMMISNWQEYKITNRAQLNFISEIVYSITFITLKMADAEGIRKMITGMYSESKNINEFAEQKKSFFRRK